MNFPTTRFPICFLQESLCILTNHLQQKQSPLSRTGAEAISLLNCLLGLAVHAVPQEHEFEDNDLIVVLNAGDDKTACLGS